MQTSPATDLKCKHTRESFVKYKGEKKGGGQLLPRESLLCLEAAAGTSQHGLAPLERSLSPVRWPCMELKATTTNAGPRARVASTCPPDRQRAQWRARVRATRKPAVCWRPQLARRSTVLQRWREASRRCGGLVWCIRRLQPARHGAHASQARVPRLL